MRAVFETDLFAPVALIEAVRPGMRARRRGHIVDVSSISGFVTYPGVGYYDMATVGVEALTDALAKEVRPLGIGATMVAPGAIRTEFRGPDSLQLAARTIDDHADTAGKSRAGTQAGHRTQQGDPARGTRVIIAAVEAGDPPVRLPIRGNALDQFRAELDDMRRETDFRIAVSYSGPVGFVWPLTLPEVWLVGLRCCERRLC